MLMGLALKAEMSGSGRLENEFAPLFAGIGAVDPGETTGVVIIGALGTVVSGTTGSGTLSADGKGAVVGSTWLCSRNIDGC